MLLFRKTYGLIQFSPRLIHTNSVYLEQPQQSLMDIKRQKLDLLENAVQGGFYNIPGKVDLQVIQSGCQGSGKSLLLSHDYRCYLFNCPEGTTRLAGEHSLKIGRLEHIFFTRNSWTNCGGLPGLTLSLNAAFVKQLTLHGPPHLKQVFDVVRPFAEESSAIEIGQKPIEDGHYEDDSVHITYIPILAEHTASDKEICATSELVEDPPTNNPLEDAKISQIFESIRKMEAKLLTAQETKSRMAAGYICRLKPKAGKLDKEKCKRLGVPVGPLLGTLQKGRDITLPSGKVVHPSDVLGQPENPPAVVVLECPTVDFLPSLMSNQAFKTQCKSLGEKNFLLVCHLSPSEIVSHPDYKEWMESLGPNAHHLIVNEDAPCTSHSVSVLNHMTKLHQVHPSIFPRIYFQKIDQIKIPHDTEARTTLAEPFMRFKLRPLEKNAVYHEEDRAYDPGSLVESLESHPNFLETRNKLSTEISRMNIGKDPFPQTIFLGTCSAQPTKYRNTSGILLNLSENFSCLLDCGEGTYQQLFSYYGPEETEKALIRMKLFYISHLHQDHHLGLFTLALKRREAFERHGVPYQPAVLLAPSPLFHMHTIYSRLIENVEDFAERFSTSVKSDEHSERIKALATRLGLLDIAFAKANHPMLAKSLIVKTGKGKKIVYSGDTRPTHDLKLLASNADLLIHEATHESLLQSLAIKFRHSTVQEAKDVGVEANAKMTLLTHFSGRYSKYPLVTQMERSEFLGVAFDFMTVSLDQLPILPKLFPLLDIVFQDELAVLEKRSDLRSMKTILQNEENQKKVLGLATA